MTRYQRIQKIRDEVVLKSIKEKIPEDLATELLMVIDRYRLFMTVEEAEEVV